METRAEAAGRQRTALTLTALLPAALGLLRPLCAAGRLSWLGPVLALPAGLWLGLLWRELGREGLPLALEGAFGRWFGRAAQLGYLLWALVLLWDSGGKYAHRLGRLLPGAEWFFLLSALAVCLWLSRGREELFARAGRLFFLAVAAALVFALALALPGLDWRNLWPPEGEDVAGAAYSALLCLSLAGYGAFALCLPCRGEGGRFGGALWGCAALAWLVLTVVGTFGPQLAGALEEPFLMALQGVEVPGAFRRGEAVLAAVLTLGDFTLLALLCRGCRSLWERLAPKGWAWGGYVLPALAILAAGAMKNGGWRQGEGWLPAGNLVLGVVVPALAVLGQRARRPGEGQPIFSAPKMAEKADVGGKITNKKSQKENQKKC